MYFYHTLFYISLTDPLALPSALGHLTHIHVIQDMFPIFSMYDIHNAMHSEFHKCPLYYLCYC